MVLLLLFKLSLLVVLCVSLIALAYVQMYKSFININYGQWWNAPFRNIDTNMMIPLDLKTKVKFYTITRVLLRTTVALKYNGTKQLINGHIIIFFLVFSSYTRPSPSCIWQSLTLSHLVKIAKRYRYIKRGVG